MTWYTEREVYLRLDEPQSNEERKESRETKLMTPRTVDFAKEIDASMGGMAVDGRAG
jgi:hypothetical protein